MSQSDPHTHLTLIEPPRGWRMLDLRELWAYRELFWVLTLRDIKVRYKFAGNWELFNWLA